ncbi:BQ2448_1752 [Microbotryum intermedium]|uniref:BQ2448_1752 protein n=1 Tax=Microbotryum intermedium TaxID=269621 RepID=A0A238FGT5_9BASI|nr:BQ2448_1752 [Microbotryum intermedium]
MWCRTHLGIPLRITGGIPHCVFCRSSERVRKECTIAPACKLCTRTSYATQHCTDRHVSGPQGSLVGGTWVTRC